MGKDPKEVREQGMQTPGVNVVPVEGPAQAKALTGTLCYGSGIREGEGRTEAMGVTARSYRVL